MTRWDTIAAIATAPGASGVAVIRVSGPDAFAIARVLTGREPAPGRIQYARFYAPSAHHSNTLNPNTQTPQHPNTATPLDTGLLLSFKSPHSYTGEDVVEFQSHGGTVTPRRILEACFAAGARLARRGEFTERAFLNGKLGYEEAEGVIDLIEAKTERAADAALAGLAGAGREKLRALYASALDLSSTIEHALDVDEGELPESFHAGVRSGFAGLAASLEAEIARAKSGRILREGALVVLTGAPNAGKSSLLNALLGENRAIVSDVPGTTRDSIEAWLDIGGWPVRLVDTAGVRGEWEKLKGGVEGGVEEVDEIEREGIRRAKELIASAEVVLALTAGDGGDSDTVIGKPSKEQAILRVSSKCDLKRGPGLNVSAVTGEGLAELKGAIASALARRAETVSEGDAGDPKLAALCEARGLLGSFTDDLVLVGNAVRSAAERLGSALGAVYSSDLLDALFSRFCVGK